MAAAGVRCLQPWTKRRLILLCVPVLSLVEVLQYLSYKRYIDRLGGSHTPVLAEPLSAWRFFSATYCLSFSDGGETKGGDATFHVEAFHVLHMGKRTHCLHRFPVCSRIVLEYYAFNDGQ